MRLEAREMREILFKRQNETSNVKEELRKGTKEAKGNWVFFTAVLLLLEAIW